MSVKIKTNDTFKYGQKNVIPFLGVAEISSEGIVEVETQEIANSIVESNIGFFFVETVTTTTTQVPVTTTTTEPITTTTTEMITTTTTEGIKPQVEVDDLGEGKGEKDSLENDNDDDEDLVKRLENLTVPDLQSMANPFPKNEWQTLKKAGLVAYLSAKLSPVE